MCNTSKFSIFSLLSEHLLDPANGKEGVQGGVKVDSTFKINDEQRTSSNTSTLKYFIKIYIITRFKY